MMCVENMCVENVENISVAAVYTSIASIVLLLEKMEGKYCSFIAMHILQDFIS